MSDSVQEIKDKLNIVDVVGGYVRLNKAGKYHKGLCPFHNERTASFTVSPERGFYHCFGCGKGGDIFSFVEEIESLDFKGALKLLAEKAGVVLENEPRENKDEKEKLFAVLSDANAFYVEERAKRKDVQAYLEKRGIKPDTTQKFHIGYAPNEWRALRDHLISKGHTDRSIEDAGLSKKPDGNIDGKKPYDRLRGRIIFPIRDVSGRTVGFSGRIFEDDPEHPQAKYINSPETPVFHKSRILYGLDMAKEGIRKYRFAVLVEGQVDLVMAHQSGFTNAVALSGTSFTEAHAALLKRHSDNLLICFDGDTAGIAAAGRAASLALPLGLNTKIALLPGGEDPADVLRKDVTVFKQIVREAKHVVDFYIKHVASFGYDERTYRLEASRLVLPFVALIQNAIDREHFISRVAAALEVSEEAVRQELIKFKSPERNSTPSVVSEKKKEISDPFLSRNDTIITLLGGMLLLFKEQHNEERYALVHSALREALGEREVASLIENPERSRAALIEADMYMSDYEDVVAETAAVHELLADFKKETARRHLSEVQKELKKYEATGDHEKVLELMQEIDRLAKVIENVV